MCTPITDNWIVIPSEYMHSLILLPIYLECNPRYCSRKFADSNIYNLTTHIHSLPNSLQ